MIQVKTEKIVEAISQDVKAEIFKKYSDLEINNLGNVVWQLLYNQPERKCAFVPIVGTGISIADKAVLGHTPIGVDLGTYSKNKAIADELNKDVLGLSDEEAMKIVMTTMQDRIFELEEAQEKINEAIDIIRQAVRGTEHEASADVYIIAHLNNWANGGNPYDETIPKLIENIRKGETQ